MKHNYRLSGRLWNWKPLAAAFGLAFIGLASATVPLYQNYSVLQYTIPGNPPPTIDATAFDNENLFQVDINAYSPWPQLYETRNTLFYTNNGTMIAGSPFTTNGFNGYLYGVYYGGLAYGAGYRFDNYSAATGLHKAADTFYNPGTIRCASVQDGNNIFNFGFGFTSFFLSTIGECRVAATNIIIPGTIDVSVDGWIQLTGQNVDLTGGVLTQETLLNTSGTGGTPNISSTGAVGVNTNYYWNPSTALQANSAVSSGPYFLSLTNSTSYFDIATTGSNTVVRVVFIQNDSPNVPANVYFSPPSPFNPNLGPGTANIEWVGTYLDPATGGTQNSYLYLNDWYEFVSTTNIFVGANGVPSNFQITSYSTPQLTGAVAAGFNNVFPNGSVATNPYSYMNAQLVASSTATNASGTNPSGALTNLPGRIEITASNELNLAYTTISGQNYLSLVAPNQFDGSPGASIASPFSDINIGVTNGFLTVSNLLLAGIPTWSGTIQAWSTRWVTTDTNGNTTDFRVLLVGSKLLPTSMPWIQSLKLHGTNSVVINDVLNVFKSISIDAQRLTVATNVVGNGATSLDGELNWYGGGTFGPAGQLAQLPNVRWLTNNGAIRSPNVAQFGSSTTHGDPANIFYGAFINSGILSDAGTYIWTTNFVNSGSVSNGSGSFVLQSRTATLTNGSIMAGGDVTITSSNLLIGSHAIQAGRMLTLQSTNLLADTGVTNGNIWVVGSAGVGGLDSGFNVPLKPAMGDLLGTTVTNYAPATKTINNLWAGTNRGISVLGFSNNLALGRLILDAANINSVFTFKGNGASNALYVDYLEFRDAATNHSAANGYDFSWLKINTNMMIYYAQAVINGVSVAEAIDFASHYQGANGGRLRWVPAYAGYFSSTNLVYPAGVTNTVNAALAASKSIDSDGDGIANFYDPTPFFVPGLVNFTAAVTTNHPPQLRLQWATVPLATNSVFYRTNLTSGIWLPFTNFTRYYYGGSSNPAAGGTFVSPQLYGSPATNVWVFDVLTNTPHFYRVEVQPWVTYPY